MGLDKIHHSTTRTKVYFIIGIFFFISLMLTGILWLQGEVFNGVRSYVRGEGLWAKAQKDAIAHLDRYSYSHNIDDYVAFLNAIKVNHGDQKARLAMNQTPVDYNGALQGFLEGKNAPEDIDSMIWFYLNFQQISYLRIAISIWEEADRQIAKLTTIASQIHEKVKKKDLSSMDELRHELYALNETLLTLENNFSQILGEGARWVKNTTWVSGLFTLFFFSIIAVWVSRQILFGITKSENNLRISESRFRSLNDSNTIGIIYWTLEGRIDDANDYFLNMLGYTQENLRAGQVNWRKMTPNDCKERDAQAVEELMNMGRCEPYEKELFDIDGNRVPVYLGASLIDEHKDRGIAFFMDLREKKAQEEQLRLAAAVFDVSHDGIIITDEMLNVISVNRAVLEMTGYDNKEIIGKKPSILQSDDKLLNDIYNELQSKGFWKGDLLEPTKDNVKLPVHVSITNIKDSNNIVTHYVFILFDITESKAREKRLVYMANHDKLTGISNREHLEFKLQNSINRSDKENRRFALLFFDLDKFKPVNDTYGHKVGDKLLQIVANRLSNHVRQSDIVARIGGDEFIILLESVDDCDRAQEISQKTLNDICLPVSIDGHIINPSASVGISIYPDDGRDIKTLMEHADQQMYNSKGENSR